MGRDSGELRWGNRTDSLRASLGYATARDALDDPRGWTVRCTPRRRTVQADFGAGITIYRKLRSADPRGGAVAEWHLLEVLRDLELRVPERVFYARLGASNVLGVAAAPGRPMDAVIAEALADGRERELEAFLVAEVVPAIQRLHAAGLCYRDLYWNHLFVDGFGDGPPTWIDVERAFAPGRRFRRWVIKDLAGLVASWPVADHADVLRVMLRAYGADDALAAAVHDKARRIRSHRPKYG